VIKSNEELEGTLERIEYFRKQVIYMRQVEKDPASYELSAGGFLAEIDKMNLEVREYLSLHPSRLEEEQIAA